MEESYMAKNNRNSLKKAQRFTLKEALGNGYEERSLEVATTCNFS